MIKECWRLVILDLQDLLGVQQRFIHTKWWQGKNAVQIIINIFRAVFEVDIIGKLETMVSCCLHGRHRAQGGWRYLQYSWLGGSNGASYWEPRKKYTSQKFYTPKNMWDPPVMYTASPPPSGTPWPDVFSDAIWVRAIAWVTVLCCWAKYLTLIMFLFTELYKRVLVNLNPAMD